MTKLILLQKNKILFNKFKEFKNIDDSIIILNSKNFVKKDFDVMEFNYETIYPNCAFYFISIFPIWRMILTYLKYGK